MPGLSVAVTEAITETRLEYFSSSLAAGSIHCLECMTLML